MTADIAHTLHPHRQLLVAFSGGLDSTVLLHQLVLLREQDCVENTLYDTAMLLLRERDRRDAMVRALQSMAVPDAAEKIYETLMEISKK